MRTSLLRRKVQGTEVELFLASALALYCEMLFIRWFPGNLQVLAYFTNIILLAAFFGLGLGCLLAKAPGDAFPSFRWPSYSL